LNTIVFNFSFRFRYQIAPDQKDSLHELLDDLGGEPSLCSLLGAATSGSVESTDASLAHLGQTEVCLTLTSKFELDSNEGADKSHVDKLFVKSKQLIMTVLPCTKETNLIGENSTFRCPFFVPSVLHLNTFQVVSNPVLRPTRPSTTGAWLRSARPLTRGRRTTDPCSTTQTSFSTTRSGYRSTTAKDRYLKTCR
jgi:hypothetical protein